MKLYRPSNGTEGDMFMDDFCRNCIKCPRNPQAKNQCGILMKSMLFDINEKEYPKQWTYDSEGNPTCTAYKNREEYNSSRKRKPKFNPNQPSLF